ncbi:hypothetical protein GOP47_0011843 [Adiantum capillus-veneris]|uniref:Uncharacterized protein n=1 Tax=Adiantum capillus-veneris TaxID=13818 RepID=A0A9D4UTI1_ADICA|nr:hypothetical protein GOP47_0011843 [Adiantum capillus-veneris]
MQRLHWGIQLCRRLLQVVKLLLENGADASELAGDGKTILHIAVDKARYPCMELLLQMGANANGRIKDDGNTPLHLAILRADEKAMEILLRHGACKELKNRSGKTPGDLAREKGQQALIFLDELVLGDELRSASRKGNLVVVRESLRYGSVKTEQDDHKWTALHIASFNGRMGVVQELLEAGADLECLDDASYTPLLCVVEAGNKDIVKLLLKHGAYVNARTSNGSTALDLATTSSIQGLLLCCSNGVDAAANIQKA